MMLQLRIAPALVSLFLVAAPGCGDPAPTEPITDTVAQADTTVVADLDAGTSNDVADVTPSVPRVERIGRVPTRMTVDQLARSIPIITGGIAWVEDFGNGPVDLLQVLAPTLGAPDYLLVTQENLEPSLIIAKFMQDAASRICTRWVDLDKVAPVESRTLVAHSDFNSLDPDDVQSNLRRLILRVHGRYVPPDNYEGIAAQYQLFSAASGAAPQGLEAHDGWLAVCLGLMTDPEILVY